MLSLRSILRRSGVAPLMAASCMWGSAALAAPVVAVSIKPLEHLVAELTAGVTAPVLVVRPGQDPHHLTLRPSERRVLADADLVIWVGPALELPLADLVEQIDGNIMTLQSLDGMHLIDTGHGPDPHLWLDSRNAELIAAAIVQQLSQMDSANRERYDANLAVFREQMQNLRTSVEQNLAYDGRKPWAVYHHAFRYNEVEFGLPAALLLRDSDNVEPGLRSVVAFRAALQQAHITCLVVEPGIRNDSLTALLDDTELRTVEADVLGIDLPVQPGSFAALMDGVMQAIQSCSGAANE